jgi:type I restriction enzyme, R subunit
VVVHEFPLERGHGYADYLLYVDGKAAGVIEAKKEGVTLTGVEVQAKKYSEGIPSVLLAGIPLTPLLNPHDRHAVCALVSSAVRSRMR